MLIYRLLEINIIGYNVGLNVSLFMYIVKTKKVIENVDFEHMYHDCLVLKKY